MPVTRSRTRQTEEETRIRQEEEYWKKVNDEGFDLDLSHAELDEELELFDRYPVSSDNWRLFFNHYFEWIVADIDESLRVAKKPTYQELEEIPFLEGGFDNSFYPRNNLDFGQKQNVINFTTSLYDTFFKQMKNTANETMRLSHIVNESLYHIFRNLEHYVDTRDLNTSIAHYSESMVIVDLLLNEHLFYLYMTGRPTGNKRRVLNSHPEYYIGIWVRKAPIWGIGNKYEHNFGQLKAFVSNYCRKMIEYMYHTNTKYNLINMGSVFYRGHLRGGTVDDIIKITSKEKNKYKTKYRILFIKKSVKNAFSRIESMLLDVIMDKKINSIKKGSKVSVEPPIISKKQIVDEKGDDELSQTKTKTRTRTGTRTGTRSRTRTETGKKG